MRIFILHCLVLMLTLVLGEAAQAQTDAQPATPTTGPLVVFVEENSLRAASVTDTGPDGLTQLAEVFQSLGARTTWQRLNEPLPAETAVVVLVRPRRALPVDYIARIWQMVGSGKSLLVGFDPQRYLDTRTETPGRGLDRLLALDEGVSLGSGILIEPWFTNQSFTELYGTFSYGYASPMPNPITEPLARYGLPVALWGARPVVVEPMVANGGQAWPLVDTQPQYVETATDIFATGNTPAEPFELNLDADQQGIVSVVGIGENRRVGSRVALLGDPEIVQNGYGLSLNTDRTPVYTADYILTQRLAAWLLKLPVEQYPPLPANMTWMILDGSLDDWPTDAPTTTDDPLDASILSLNVQEVRAFRNHNYLYVSVRTVAPANPDAQIDLELDTLGVGIRDTVVTAKPGEVMAQISGQPAALVPDAAIAIGENIELRIPLRVTGPSPRIIDLCLSSARELAFPQAPDCVQTQVNITGLDQADPVPLPMTGAPLVAVKGDGQNRINLRSAPNDESSVVTSVGYGTVFTAVGINASRTWVRVENANYGGWVLRAGLFAPGNLDSLPVMP